MMEYEVGGPKVPEGPVPLEFAWPSRTLTDTPSPVTRSLRPSPFTSRTRKGKVVVKVVTDGTIDERPTPLAQNDRHSPCVQRSAAVQVLLQVPQWVAFVWAFTQAPPHEVMQPVLQMPLLPHTPRSLATVEEQTAQVGPHASV